MSQDVSLCERELWLSACSGLSLQLLQLLFRQKVKPELRKLVMVMFGNYQ